jgi:LmbE family N-acetylglucosaminyl deacetylase
VARSKIRNLGRLLREAGEADIGTPDELITTEVDVSPQVERKRQALMAHASQMGPEVFFAKMPAALFYRLFGRESFQLARGQSGASGLESDLFAGLRGQSRKGASLHYRHH